MKDTENKSRLRYVTCDNCGDKIHEGNSVYYTPGLVYHCCSVSCLADLMIDVRQDTLDDTYMDQSEVEWEGKDE